jgi:uncharacterized protein (DUF1800 family)
VTSSASLQAAIAAHRFGLGEPDLSVVGSDARGWLAAQIGAADPARGDGLLDTRRALEHVAAEREKRELARNPPPGTTALRILAGHYRAVNIADARSRLATAAATRRPFAERLHWFWANHFTVSLVKGSTRGLTGAFERDAIRPHIAGRFETLLFAATTHPAMLRYLDNTQSAGPHSRVVAFESRRAARRQEPARVTGINENLAREVLELHTLGAEAARAGVYSQADVTAFAAVLSGWRVGQDAGWKDGEPFEPNWHQPGTKTLLGRTYGEGPQALHAVLRDLASHPATAHLLASKLARHFVADEPPPSLVGRLASVYLQSGGELAPVYRALLASDAAWQAPAAKLKTPEEFVVSTARLLGAGERMFEHADVVNPAAAIGALGQRMLAAPSPAGWSDRADDWLGPDAVWKRVEWATRMAARAGRTIDARRLAEQSLGPLLGAETARQLERAADAPQALALLLLAPEFQRR